jgi:Cupin domain
MEFHIAPAVTLYLGGQVRKQILPLFESSPGQTGPPLKRLLLPQGELAQLLDGDHPIRYLAFVELREGAVRGNHFHQIKQEQIYVIRGRALLSVEAPDSKAKDAAPLEEGDLVFISAGVAHRLDVIEAGQAVEFSEERFDPSDIHSYAVSANPQPEFRDPKVAALQ